jgi:hypothetical protein
VRTQDTRPQGKDDDMKRTYREEKLRREQHKMATDNYANHAQVKTDEAYARSWQEVEKSRAWARSAR